MKRKGKINLILGGDDLFIPLYESRKAAHNHSVVSLDWCHRTWHHPEW
jgi:hypothetical protein